jgi:hypothetical protein
MTGATPKSDGDTGPARAPDPEGLQILATEHWSLLATRSLTWNESFARTGMFFTVLSASVVALALIAQATGFGDGFLIFALVLLPVVLFVGLTTYFRLVAVNIEDGWWVIGMNRLRAAYFERRPELARFFVSGATDDLAGMARTFMGRVPDARPNPLPLFLHGFTTTPGLVATVSSVVAGVLAGVIALKFGAGMGACFAAGGVAFAAVFVLLIVHQMRVLLDDMRTYVPKFPEAKPTVTPPAAAPGGR